MNTYLMAKIHYFPKNKIKALSFCMAEIHACVAMQLMFQRIVEAVENN